MVNEQITAYCLSKIGAYEDYPFGEIPICYKVCGKLFLQLYPMPGNHKITVSCDSMMADFYRCQYAGAVVPGYHCPRGLKPYMNTVCLNGIVEDAVIYQMIDQSYKRVVGRLPHKEREQLATLSEENR